MNFLVIGHSVIDRIKQSDTIEIKPGGIFYTVASLFGFSEENDKIFLCTIVNKTDYNLFAFLYDKLESEYIQYACRIPVVNLMLKSTGEREEIYENVSENIDIDYEQINRFDGILVNMVTGFDISIEQMKKLRENYSGIIYFDVHTLSRGIDHNYKRVFRKVPEFFKWAQCIDILQANRNEIKTLSDKKSEEEIVKELLGYGIRQIIITKSSRGAILYYLENGKMKILAQNAIRTQTVNEIGCGDVFGAVYFYNYIRSKNAAEALLLANTAAGVSTSYLKVQNLLNLKADVRKQFN
jgi:sugar/nucleoside kinase (ribokinase family)